MAVMLALSAGGARAASDAADLLENDRAFAFAARAVDPTTVEARFVVAPGYYLYRDKLRLTVEGGTLARPPKLPAGKLKRDEFFGESETYRGTVVLELPLTATTPGAVVKVTAESQGCADLGVCYPPQRQEVSLTLPGRRTPSAAFVEPGSAKKRWFR